jgi:hypothetical protein
MIREIELSKEKWETWLKAKGLSPRTIQNYNEYFDKFNVLFLSQSYLNEFVQQHNNPVARAMLKHVFHYIRTNEFPVEVKELAKEIVLIRIETIALVLQEMVKVLAVHKDHLVLEQMEMFAAMMCDCFERFCDRRIM